jgi:hypothetical protein
MKLGYVYSTEGLKNKGRWVNYFKIIEDYHIKVEINFPFFV